MILVIRIAGQVGVKEKVAETLFRLKLRKKLTCVLIDEKDEVKMGMLDQIKDHVAYGKVDEGVIKKLKEKRGKDEKKGFFRLHPPVGGFKKSTKLAVNQGGILREHKDISKLLLRML